MLHAVLISLLFIFCNFSYGVCSSGSSTPLVPALYVFGDSLVDSGNNNWLKATAKANYRPYGIDFPCSIPTGRFSNGKTVADIFCDYLRLPCALPYYGELEHLDITGYNYASGSCGILPETRGGDCSDLENQVGNFEKTLNSISQYFADEEELSQYLSKSIFLVVVGNNDYLNYFNENSNYSKTCTPEAFAEILIIGLSQKLQKLYELGARKAVVAEVGAIGCMPASRNYVDKYCNETKNQIVSIYNQKLAVMMQIFATIFPDSQFTLFRIFELSNDAYNNPAKYGLTNTTGTCCNVIPNRGLCNPFIKKTCENRREYFFWDGFHPTEAIYNVVATKCINESCTCLPWNIQQLVQVEPNPSVSQLSVA